MSAHHEPTYQDAVAVISGLERLGADLYELARQVSSMELALRTAALKGDIHKAAVDFEPLVRQLSWLAGDAARMQAGLAREGESS